MIFFLRRNLQPRQQTDKSGSEFAAPQLFVGRERYLQCSGFERARQQD